MDFISILMLAFITGFTIYQGYLSLKTFMNMRKELKMIQANKKNVVICKDYFAFALIYALLTVFMFGYGFLYVKAELYLLGGLFVVFSIFCFVFVIDSIATRTTVFYDGGFLCYGKTFKYRSVLNVEEKSRILRGSEIKIIGETTPIYVSKKSKAILEERLLDYKNKSKKRK